MGSAWSWDRAWETLPILLDGFKITLLATAVGSVVAIVLGLLVAVIQQSGFKPITGPLSGLFTFIRSTPIIVQLFAALELLSPPIEPLYIGIGVIGIHYATYQSEAFRAGIDAVPRHQWEACTALSLPRTRTWGAVILPQALRGVVPALGNNIVAMFKDTPYLSVIGVQEMVRVAGEYGGKNFSLLEAYTLAGLIFLVASYPTSLFIRWLEVRLARY